MNIETLILSRRTIRRFLKKPIPPGILDRLIEAARLAPSAANRQPCEFLVVDDPARAAQVFPLVSWAGYIAPAGTPADGERPVAYILIVVNRQKTPDVAVHDAAAAAMNMIYTGLANGIGACWMAAIDRRSLKKLLSIPDHCDLDSLLALGYPAEMPVVETMTDSIKYWKDAAGLLHVPKRALGDILHRNAY